MAITASSRMTLQLISFAMILIGAIVFIMGILFTIIVVWTQGGLTASAVLDSDEDLADTLAIGTGTFMASSIVLIADGSLGILSGVFGIRTAQHPTQSQPALSFGIATVVFAAVDLILMIAIYPFMPTLDLMLPYDNLIQAITSIIMSVITIVVSVIFVVLTYRIRKMMKLRAFKVS